MVKGSAEAKGPQTRLISPPTGSSKLTFTPIWSLSLSSFAWNLHHFTTSSVQ